MRVLLLDDDKFMLDVLADMIAGLGPHQVLRETDGRRARVAFDAGWDADAARRDFTINGMFFDPLHGRLIDFVGGKADAFQFLVGEGQMLEQFDQAVRGMKVGESKTFPLQFPADYHGADVAGREADFMVTMKKIEAQHLPEVDDGFAKSLGIADGTVEALRADVRKNLEREVKFRVLAKNKAAAMEALAAAAQAHHGLGKPA